MAMPQGIRIMVVASHQRVAFIPRASTDPRPDLYRCHLMWSENHTLLVGWADTVKVICLSEQKDGPPVAEVTDIFQVDCMVGGVAYHGDDFVILAHTTDDAEWSEGTGDGLRRRPASSRPELRIISRTGEELSSDALDLTSFEKYRADDYRLCPKPDQSDFLILSPRDLVVAKVRGPADHIDWLLEHDRYEEAIRDLETGPQPATHDVGEIGRRLLEHLAEHGEPVGATEDLRLIDQWYRRLRGSI